jgi:hypothetical protein
VGAQYGLLGGQGVEGEEIGPRKESCASQTFGAKQASVSDLEAGSGRAKLLVA